LPVLQPATLRDASIQQALAALSCDVMVVAAYGLILPQPVLAWPRLGCVNVHASLLPRWRGAAPIQRAIEAGDRETGITLMQMDEGLDTGPMLLARSISIGEDETGGSLHDRLAALGAEMIVHALDRLAEGPLVATPQPEVGVTYASRLQRAEEWLDWTLPATALAHRIRAFDPDARDRAWCRSRDGARCVAHLDSRGVWRWRTRVAGGSASWRPKAACARVVAGRADQARRAVLEPSGPLGASCGRPS
jgi:methionyl-tRNA formyltransferase